MQDLCTKSDSRRSVFPCISGFQSASCSMQVREEKPRRSSADVMYTYLFVFLYMYIGL
jgi:hypothetical protein